LTKLQFWFLFFYFLSSQLKTNNMMNSPQSSASSTGGGAEATFFGPRSACRISYAVRAMSSLHRIGLATAAGARRHLLFSPTRFPPRTTLGGVLIASGAAGYAFAGWLHRRHLQETTNAYNDAHYYHERHRRHLVRAARG
jgi:hypothetical protein